MGKVICINERVGIIMNDVDIQGLTNKILEEYTDGSFPVDPVIIAQKIGIPITQVNFKKLNGDKVLGGIKKNHQKISIYVNANDSMIRKRFTIAHELGHFFLKHIDNKGECVDLHREAMVTNSKEEQDANEFAACLLMPREKILDKYNILRDLKFGTRLIEGELAKIFSVSQAAIRVRLIKLNLG